MLTFSEAAQWFCREKERISLVPSSPSRTFFHDRMRLWRRFCALSWLSFTLCARAGSPSVSTNPVELVGIQGTVEVARAGQSVWDLASTQIPYRRLHPGDQVRTKERSR